MAPKMDDTVRLYFERLTAGNTEGVLALFAPEGQVQSPFLGRVRADAFFRKLADSSRNSMLTVHDVLLNPDASTAAARFRYDWELSDGTEISFEGVDYFRFDRDGKIAEMLIYYDTHPLRKEVGDKYSRA